MKGCYQLGIAHGLTLLAVLAAANVAAAQATPDLGYQYSAANAANAYTTTSASFTNKSDLAKEVAELREWKEGLDKKEAAAKK